MSSNRFRPRGCPIRPEALTGDPVPIRTRGRAVCLMDVRFGISRLADDLSGPLPKRAHARLYCMSGGRQPAASENSI